MVNAIGLVITGIISAMVAVVALAMANTILVFIGVGNVESGAFGASAPGLGTTQLGLWSLLPLLFPFIVVSIILIGIYAVFKNIGD